MTLRPGHRIRRRRPICLVLAALCAVTCAAARGQTPDRARQIIDQQLDARSARPAGPGISGREADAIYQKYLGGADHPPAAAAPGLSAASGLAGPLSQ